MKNTAQDLDRLHLPATRLWRDQPLIGMAEIIARRLDHLTHAPTVTFPTGRPPIIHGCVKIDLQCAKRAPDHQHDRRSIDLARLLDRVLALIERVKGIAVQIPQDALTRFQGSSAKRIDLRILFDFGLLAVDDDVEQRSKRREIMPPELNEAHLRRIDLIIQHEIAPSGEGDVTVAYRQVARRLQQANRVAIDDRIIGGFAMNLELTTVHLT